MPNIKLSEYCCQPGIGTVNQGTCTPESLVITRRGKAILRFAPLGNQPKHPKLALVGITPGSQSEDFARLLRVSTVEVAARKAAFARGQPQIKELLAANGFAAHVGLDLAGDLNDNPDIFTTSLVKCCLMVGGSYKYKAPEICGQPRGYALR